MNKNIKYYSKLFETITEKRVTENIVIKTKIDYKQHDILNRY